MVDVGDMHAFLIVLVMMLNWIRMYRLQRLRRRRRLLHLIELRHRHRHRQARIVRARAIINGQHRLLLARAANDRQRRLFGQQRQIWVHPREQQWWTELSQCPDNERWKENFRMSRATFNFVVDAVSPYMLRVASNFRQPISVEKRVAVALWRMATGCDYRSTRELFGIGRSTSCSIFHEFITAVVTSLSGEYLRRPTPAESLVITQGFRDIWGFPQCAGAIDGTHIPIIAPREHRNDYYNRKGWYSVICQAICDHRYIFWDIEVGWPGKVHDARVFNNSIVHTLAAEGQLFPNRVERFGDVDVPIFIIGDPAYPLQPWLMKPYREIAGITDEQHYFNYRLSRARMTIECAFGRLKGRWRCLMKRNDTDVSIVPTLVMAACILHNICEKRGDGYEEDNAPFLEQPSIYQNMDNVGPELEREGETRDAICTYLFATRN